MKGRHATVITSVGLGGILLLSLMVPEVMISPGHLLADHAKLEKDCLSCHTFLRGSPSRKCIACHTVAEIGLQTARKEQRTRVPFHQKLEEENCVACHSDHQGVAAFRPLRRFSHALLNETVGKQCLACHVPPGDALHAGMGNNCNTCHTTEAWQPATFDHDRYFRFDRDHRTTCATCHVNKEFSTFTCYGCHEHTPANIRREHWEEGIRPFSNCAECHRSADEHEAKRRWRSQGNYEPSDHDDHD